MRFTGVNADGFYTLQRLNKRETVRGVECEDTEAVDYEWETAGSVWDNVRAPIDGCVSEIRCQFGAKSVSKKLQIECAKKKNKRILITLPFAFGTEVLWQNQCPRCFG